MSEFLFEPLKPACLSWQDNTPSSKQYGDLYFSRQDGLAESRHVFLQHNNLAQRWQQLPEDENFTIAETGFGTGLNFLLAAQLWLESAPESACLHYVSFEKHPLEKPELKKALAYWPQLADFSEELLHNYPPMVPGFHRRDLCAGKIRLTLVWADAQCGLSQAQFKANAWFLDGFSPSQNEDMWSDALLSEVAQHTADRGTFATFTAVGKIRRSLTSLGFTVKKVPGFGTKREMLIGSKQTEVEPEQQLPYRAKPWLVNQQCFAHPRQAVVVGAGLAGSAIAYQLADRGWQVTVLDEQPGPAMETSSNPLALTFTKASAHFTPQNRFYQHSYLYALNRLKQFSALGLLDKGQDWNDCGLVQLSIDQATAERQRKAAESGYWPLEQAKYCSAHELAQISGVACQLDGLWFPKAAWVKPQQLCRAQLAHKRIHCEYQQSVKQLKVKESKWCLHTAEGKEYQAEVVIFAAGLGCNAVEQLSFLPLKPMRGQVTSLADNDDANDLKVALCHEGYVTPAVDAMHHIGATFTPAIPHKKVMDEDHKKNIQQLRQYCPSLWAEVEPEIVGGNTGLRCQTPDYLPVIGPLPDQVGFSQAYGVLAKGARKGLYPINQYYSGVYALAGLGSRGITQSLYGAELLAAQITGEPAATDLEIQRVVHPGRFALKALR